jgi:hydroxymethylpyrimidine pyrophosphatase-like HAD family hydrolase
MGNASDQVKRIAGGVSGPNSADGWAEAVERYVLVG